MSQLTVIHGKRKDGVRSMAVAAAENVTDDLQVQKVATATHTLLCRSL